MPGSMSDIIELRTGRSDSITVASRLGLVLVAAQPEKETSFHVCLASSTSTPDCLVACGKGRTFGIMKKIAHRQQLFFNACSWAKLIAKALIILSRPATLGE